MAFLNARGLLRETLLLVVLGAYLVAGARFMTPGAAGIIDAFEGRYPGLARADDVRGRIYVPVAEAEHHRQSRRFCLCTRGTATFAGPDAPEVYYLSNLRTGHR